MMDTGIDVPEILNLVFFKKVRSKIKFWQMIGRGTRLCEDLAILDSIDGEYVGKRRFFIFDWCRNFEFFGEGGNTIEGKMARSLAESVFCSQVKLVHDFQTSAYADEAWQEWRQNLVDTIHYQVVSLDYDHVSVRLNKQYVEKFKQPESYIVLTDLDTGELERYVAPLVTNDEKDSYALRFDALMYGFMCSLCDGFNIKSYMKHVLRIAGGLEKRVTIPQIKEKLPFIQRINSEGFFADISALALEQIRVELRDLVKFLADGGRPIVMTNVTDTITSQTEGVFVESGEDFSDYRLKVNRFLSDYGNRTVIHKLHHNIPMTKMEYDELERIFTRELGTKTEYEQTYGNEPFGLLVRKLVKLDHDATMQAFADFMNDNSLSDQQIAFVHRVVDYVELNGYMEPAELTKAPFDRPLSFIKLFNATQQRKLVATIKRIKENAEHPAA